MAASGSEFITLENMAGIVDGMIEIAGGTVSFPKYYWYGQWTSGQEGVTIPGLFYNGITSGVYSYDENMRTLTFTIAHPGTYRITSIDQDSSNNDGSLYAIYFPGALSTRVQLNSGAAVHVTTTSANQQFKLSTGGRTDPIFIEYIGDIGSDKVNYIDYMGTMNNGDFKILQKRGTAITVGEPLTLGYYSAVPFTFQKNGVYAFYGSVEFLIQVGNAYTRVTGAGDPALIKVDNAPQTFYRSVSDSNRYGSALSVEALSLD